MRDLPLRWFEEPCHWDDDKRDMAQMRALSGMPICAGQSESTLQGCRDMIREGAIDICNLDASWGGGPTVWLRVAKMAQAFGIEMAHPVIPEVPVAELPHIWISLACLGERGSLPQDFKPLTDMRASDAYRLKVSQNLIRKLWLETLDRKTITIWRAGRLAA